MHEAYAALRARFRRSISYPEFREIVGWQALRAVSGVIPALRSLHRKGTVRTVFSSNVERATWDGLCRKYRLNE